MQDYTLLQFMTPHLKVLEFLSRICGKPNPSDFFLFLRNDVHSHQHIQRVVNTASYILLVICLLKRVVENKPAQIIKDFFRSLEKSKHMAFTFIMSPHLSAFNNVVTTSIKNNSFFLLFKSPV